MGFYTLFHAFFQRLDDIFSLLWLPRFMRASHLIYDVDFGGKRRRNISTYDAERTVFYSWLWLFTSTVLDSFAIFSTVALGCLCYLVGYLRCPSTDTTSDTTATVYLPRASWCIPVPTESNFLTLSTLASFLCGFLLSLTMQRWWSVRTLIQNVIGRSNNLTMLVGSHVVGQDDQTAHARREVVRLLNLAHALIYKQAYREDSMSDLEERGLLLREEHEHLRATPSRATVVYGWISHVLRQLATSQRLVFPEHVLPVLLNDVTVMRSAASDLFMYMTTLLPYTYIHLVILIVRLHLMLLFMVCAGQVGKSLDEGSRGGVVASVTAFVTNVIVYHAILRIHAMLADPIGVDPDDFPTFNFQRSLERSTNVLLDRMEAPPSSITGVLSFLPGEKGAGSEGEGGEGAEVHPEGEAGGKGLESGPRISLRVPEPTSLDGEGPPPVSAASFAHLRVASESSPNGNGNGHWPFHSGPTHQPDTPTMEPEQRRASRHGLQQTLDRRSEAGSRLSRRSRVSHAESPTPSVVRDLPPRGKSRAGGVLRRGPGGVTHRHFDWEGEPEEDSDGGGLPPLPPVPPGRRGSDVVPLPGGRRGSEAEEGPSDHDAAARAFRAGKKKGGPRVAISFRSASSINMSPGGGAIGGGRSTVQKAVRVLDMS